MPATTFVNESIFAEKAVPDVAGLREWIPMASRILRKRIAVESFVFTTKRFFRKKRVMLYSVLLDIGYGEAQILNFAPRDGSDWSINHYVTSQEVAAWAMGVVAGSDAALGEGK